MRHLSFLCSCLCGGLFALAIVTAPACRKDDGTAPTPKAPTGPSAVGPQGAAAPQPAGGPGGGTATPFAKP